MIDKNLTSDLYNYLMDPKNPMYNFNLGYTYEKLGHTAAAASFYIRCGEFASEYEDNKLLTYESLLRLGLCFEKQGSRVFTTKGIWLRAISLMPERPEAHFLLARLYEINKEWQEGYTQAVIGENLIEHNPEQKLLTNVEYPGKYGFTFERAVTAWWLGLWDESIATFRELQKNPKMEGQYVQITNNNLNNLGNAVWKNPIEYSKDYHYEHIKIKFPGLENVTRNYSQCYQDLFVLTMLNGKRKGKFLEIGSAQPYYGNNTALLEKSFEWTGISIDYNKTYMDEFTKERSSTAICADATKLNYDKILEESDYDYLQLDCNPPVVTYNTLLKIPFHNHRFAVITFEHDHYADESSNIREKSRKYLQSLGYELVIANVAPDNYNSFEDWWVHPDLVNRDIINRIKNTSEMPKRADKLMFGRYDRKD